jgi:hypothetical protein
MLGSTSASMASQTRLLCQMSPGEMKKKFIQILFPRSNPSQIQYRQIVHARTRATNVVSTRLLQLLSANRSGRRFVRALAIKLHQHEQLIACNEELYLSNQCHSTNDALIASNTVIRILFNFFVFSLYF